MFIKRLRQHVRLASSQQRLTRKVQLIPSKGRKSKFKDVATKVRSMSGCNVMEKILRPMGTVSQDGRATIEREIFENAPEDSARTGQAERKILLTLMPKRSRITQLSTNLFFVTINKKRFCVTYERCEI